MKTVKDVTGRNMDWFFEQFLFLPGHPVFDVSSDWNAESGEVRVQVAQVQRRDHGVPIYRTPVRIGIVTSSGKRVEEVWLNRERETFVFPSQEEPLLVRFDEGNWLLKEWSYEKSVEELLFQAENDDAIGRAWAAREMVDAATAPAVAAVLTKLTSEDPFWGARVAALETLGVGGGPGALESFKEAALDVDSRVRRAAIRLLGDTGGPDLIPFFQNRFSQDDSYLVQAEALRSIGRLGDRRQLPFLREALRVPSHQDVIRQAAEWAIEELSKST